MMILEDPGVPSAARISEFISARDTRVCKHEIEIAEQIEYHLLYDAALVPIRFPGRKKKLWSILVKQVPSERHPRCWRVFAMHTPEDVKNMR